MPRKCSVAGCNTGYDRERRLRGEGADKINTFGFPPDIEERQAWISAIPNFKGKTVDSVTKAMCVCALHWPGDVPLKRRGKYLVPAVPPSLFPNVDDYGVSREMVEGKQLIVPFISLLAQWPGIWQKSHPEFYKQDIKQKRFAELGAAAGMTASDCLKRFTSLKNSMRTQVAKLPKTSSGSPDFSDTSKITWPFFQQMLFMREEFQGSKSSPSVDYNDSTGDKADGDEYNDATGDKSEGDEYNDTTGDKAEGDEYNDSTGDKAEGDEYNDSTGGKAEGDEYNDTKGDKGEGDKYNDNTGDKTEGDEYNDSTGDKAEGDNDTNESMLLGECEEINTEHESQEQQSADQNTSSCSRLSSTPQQMSSNQSQVPVSSTGITHSQKRKRRHNHSGYNTDDSEEMSNVSGLDQKVATTDEFGMFALDIANDLRKIKCPLKLMQAKAKIRRIAEEAVISELCPPESSSDLCPPELPQDPIEYTYTVVECKASPSDDEDVS